MGSDGREETEAGRGGGMSHREREARGTCVVDSVAACGSKSWAGGKDIVRNQ